MEDDLNKSSFRMGGAAGRPPHDNPHTAAADPYVPPMGNEPIGRLSLHGPKPATRLAMGLQPFCPWSARDRPGGPHRIPPQEGYAAPVVDAPAGPFNDGSHADMRGAAPTLGVRAWGELRWLFSHQIHFVAGQRRSGLLPGRCTANSKYMKQTSRTLA